MAFLIFFSASPPFLHVQFSYQDMATVHTAHGELGVGFTSVSHKQQGDQKLELPCKIPDFVLPRKYYNGTNFLGCPGSWQDRPKPVHILILITLSKSLTKLNKTNVSALRHRSIFYMLPHFFPLPLTGLPPRQPSA
jgi:hypothetical protein